MIVKVKNAKIPYAVLNAQISNTKIILQGRTHKIFCCLSFSSSTTDNALQICDVEQIKNWEDVVETDSTMKQ